MWNHNFRIKNTLTFIKTQQLVEKNRLVQSFWSTWPPKGPGKADTHHGPTFSCLVWPSAKKDGERVLCWQYEYMLPPVSFKATAWHLNFHHLTNKSYPIEKLWFNIYLFDTRHNLHLCPRCQTVEEKSITKHTDCFWQVLHAEVNVQMFRCKGPYQHWGLLRGKYNYV